MSMTMMHPEDVASLPLWIAGLLMTALAVCGAIVVELVARRAVPLELRRDNAAVASAMFTVIGTTYAVLLAFVAMLAWEGFNKAEAVANSEASVLQDIVQLLDGVQGPESAAMLSDTRDYARAVIDREWPAQAAGRPVADDEPHLRRLVVTSLHIRDTAFSASEIHGLLLNAVMRLDAVRRERLATARTPMPGIIWFVLIAGGAITVAFGSFLGASSLRMHLAMSSLLAVSGALVLLVIVSLSNPFRGDLAVSPAPYARAIARAPVA